MQGQRQMAQKGGAKALGSYSTKQMTELALLIAVIGILSYTPLGYIKTFGLEITMVVVPVAVGAVTLGPFAGAVLGGAFGIMSYSRWVMGMSAFGMMLFEINPAATFVVCVIARIIMGWLTGVIYQGLKRVKFLKKTSLLISNLLAPLLNTTLFMSALILFFYQTDYIQGMAASMHAKNALVFVAAFVGINGLVEAVVCFIVGSAVSKALLKALRG